MSNQPIDLTSVVQEFMAVTDGKLFGRLTVVGRGGIRDVARRVTMAIAGHAPPCDRQTSVPQQVWQGALQVA